MFTNKKNKKIELYFFWFVIFLNILPVLSVKFFVTTDGPAHLYNSNIINQLLFYSNDAIEKYFVFNNEIVPNWTGHIILALFNLLLPAYLAEKALMVLYLVLLPVSFRCLIKNISSQSILCCYLVFPFTYSYPFFIGFFNFSVSLIFLFFILSYWIKNEHKIFKIKKILILFFLINATYFSHLFVFAFLIICISLHITFKAAYSAILSGNDFKKDIYDFLKKYLTLLIASSLTIVLSIIYLRARTYGNASYVDHPQLVMWLKNIRPYLTLDPVEKPRQEIFTKIIFYTIFTFFLMAVYYRIKTIEFQNVIKRKSFILFLKNFFYASDFWFLISGILLLLYFVFPNHFMGGAGVVSVRFELIFFLFLFIWISTILKNKKIIITVIIVVLICSFSLNYSYYILAKKYNVAAVECNNASEHIDPNSTVFSINFPNNMCYENITDYVGVDKPIIMLDNYECFFDWFPLQWKEETSFKKIYGNFILNPNFPKMDESYTKENYIKADYVFVFENVYATADSIKVPLKKIISENYNLEYKSQYCKLYKNKRKIGP